MIENTQHLEELREFPDPEYKKKYKVSSLGKIYHISDKKYIKIYTEYEDGSRVRFQNKYHKLDEIIARTFLGDNKDMFLEHIDKDLNNNHINNLRYIKYEDYLENTYGSKWKIIKDYPEYYISDSGNVWSKFTKKILVNNLNKSGYNRVLLNGKQVYNHKLVATEFIENPRKCEVVNHINGDKSDNRSVNLEWCTTLENNLHSKNILGNVNSTETYEYCDPPDNYVELEWLKGYLITRDGKVFSLFTNRYLTLLNEESGCYKVEANKKRYRVHRLVAEAYLKKPSEDSVNVIHLDGDPFNNKVENLKWADTKETSEIANKNNPNRYKNQSKKIACLNKDTQKLIKIYESISEAARNTEIDKGNIAKACKDINKNAGGYKWKYYEENE